LPTATATTPATATQPTATVFFPPPTVYVDTEPTNPPPATANVPASTATAAETVEIVATLDNTLYQSSSGATSNGKGGHLFIGKTDEQSNSLRRALVQFDLAGAVPAGATVVSAELAVTVSMVITGGQLATVHRVTASWGEGASDAGTPGGKGAPSTPGDATWTHRLFPDQVWERAGGDYVTTASAQNNLFDNGVYTIGSTPGLVADVQEWVDNPSSNFGWLIRGNESTRQSAKRLNSRESTTANSVPRLIVRFTR
jgi:hypothetical protein